jgi:hypothetical protein
MRDNLCKCVMRASHFWASRFSLFSWRTRRRKTDDEQSSRMSMARSDVLKFEEVPRPGRVQVKRCA